MVTALCFGVQALSSFLPMFVELRLHTSTEHVAKLNVLLSKRCGDNWIVYLFDVPTFIALTIFQVKGLDLS